MPGMVSVPAQAPVVAVIDEQACIGCALCVEVCPVDAILGAPKLMHTVIAAECTGCGWCLPPCPVDCIALVERGESLTHDDRKRRAAQYRQRHFARRARLGRERDERLAAARSNNGHGGKQAAVDRAMQRAARRLRDRKR